MSKNTLTANILAIIAVAALLTAKWCGAQETCHTHKLTQTSGSVLICEKRKPR